MAMRSVYLSRSGLNRLMEANRQSVSTSGMRSFSSDGRVLSEEERAKENVFIQKWERERLEKLKQKEDKEKAERDKSEKKAEEGVHRS